MQEIVKAALPQARAVYYDKTHSGILDVVKHQAQYGSQPSEQSYWTSGNTSVGQPTSGSVGGLNYTCTANAMPSNSYGLSSFM